MLDQALGSGQAFIRAPTVHVEQGSNNGMHLLHLHHVPGLCLRYYFIYT